MVKRVKATYYYDFDHFHHSGKFLLLQLLVRSNNRTVSNPENRRHLKKIIKYLNQATTLNSLMLMSLSSTNKAG